MIRTHLITHKTLLRIGKMRKQKINHPKLALIVMLVSRIRNLRKNQLVQIKIRKRMKILKTKLALLMIRPMVH